MSKARRRLGLALVMLMAAAAVAQAGASFANGLTDGKSAHVRQFVLADAGPVALIAPGPAASSRVLESVDAFFRSP